MTKIYSKDGVAVVKVETQAQIDKWVETEIGDTDYIAIGKYVIGYEYGDHVGDLQWIFDSVPSESEIATIIEDFCMA